MKIHLLTICVGLFLIFTTISCIAQKASTEKLLGKYVQKKNPNIELRLSGSGFVLIDTYERKHLPLFKCCDTLAYGTWEVENESFLKLNSPEEFTSPFVYMSVEESGNDSDSLYFYFNSPIEEHYENFNEKGRELYYSIIAETSNTDLMMSLVKKSDKNPIVVPNPKNAKIDRFYIEVIPKSDMPLRELNSLRVSTMEYEVRQTDSNVFRIQLPQLSYEYFAYKRLVDDYVKISDSSKKLIWNGHEYAKTK